MASETSCETPAKEITPPIDLHQIPNPSTYDRQDSRDRGQEYYSTRKAANNSVRGRYLVISIRIGIIRRIAASVDISMVILIRINAPTKALTFLTRPDQWASARMYLKHWRGAKSKYHHASCLGSYAGTITRLRNRQLEGGKKVMFLYRSLVRSRRHIS